MRYAKNAGAVFSLKYHVVFCPKYRRPVLQSPVDTRLKELFERIASDYELTLHAMEIMPDHVHLFVEATAFSAPLHWAFAPLRTVCSTRQAPSSRRAAPFRKRGRSSPPAQASVAVRPRHRNQPALALPALQRLDRYAQQLRRLACTYSVFHVCDNKLSRAICNARVWLRFRAFLRRLSQILYLRSLQR